MQGSWLTTGHTCWATAPKRWEIFSEQDWVWKEFWREKCWELRLKHKNSGPQNANGPVKMTLDNVSHVVPESAAFTWVKRLVFPNLCSLSGSRRTETPSIHTAPLDTRQCQLFITRIRTLRLRAGRGSWRKTEMWWREEWKMKSGRREWCSETGEGERHQQLFLASVELFDQGVGRRTHQLWGNKISKPKHRRVFWLVPWNSLVKS